MEYPKRKTIRLPEFDYDAGAYFVTMCTQDRRCVLSDIVVGDGVLDVPHVQLSECGKAVEQTLEEINNTYHHISILKSVIMPNHIHLLVQVEENGTSRTPSPTNKPLPLLVSTLKRFANKKCGMQLWQRSYHEHIIRNEQDYLDIWNYIEGNPAKWAEDRYYTQ
ncbi:MAG: transposase [Oscillospiraceae bacterium]|nr:transposase [Oscillospiraceae bacterium]